MTHRILLVAVAFQVTAMLPALAAPFLTSASGGKVRAVVIGIDRYASVQTLHGSVADAEDLADALHSGDATVEVLLDDKATRAGIIAAMDRLVANSRSGDLAVITYSGHGARTPELNLPGWKGLEPDGKNEEFVLGGFTPSGAGTGEVIVNKEMKSWLARLDAKGVDILLVADTCFGGGAVRRVDDRSKPWTTRELGDGLPRPDLGKAFKPIPMTLKELVTKVIDLPHVTFLAGADREHEVPEVQLPNLSTPRGALSYSVARMLRGGVSEATEGPITRRQLFGTTLQVVGQYTDDRQDIDREPKSQDPAVMGIAVFRLVGSKTLTTGGLATSVAAEKVGPKHLSLAFLHGDGAALRAMTDLAPPFDVVPGDDADLVWDLATNDVLSHGDVLRRSAELDDFPGVLSRMAAVRAIKALSDSRPLTLTLEQGGKAYTPRSAAPMLHAADLAGRDLVVFNLASNGILQMLWPDKGDAPFTSQPNWSYAPNVTPPFGADQVVAVSAPKSRLDNFSSWLWSHDQQPAASLVAERLATLVTAEPDSRIGTVDLFTDP